MLEFDNEILNKITILKKNKITIKTKNYEFEIINNLMKTNDEYFVIYDKNFVNEKIKICVDEENIIYLEDIDFYNNHKMIEMLFALLQVIRNNKKLYYFEDKSTLSYICILLYGETWYMKNIYAIPSDKNFSNSLQKINDYLDNNKDKFYKYFNIERLISITRNKKINNFNIQNLLINNIILENIKIEGGIEISKKKLLIEIKNCYNSSNSSREFFGGLYQKFGMSVFSIIDYMEYFKFVEKKLKTYLHFDSYMEIPQDVISKIDVIESVNIENNV